MVGFAVVIVVGFLTAAGDNARITRMKTHGIPVSITVSDCIGNLGGSGSSAAGYTCRGTYAIDTQPYEEVIGGLSSFSSPGTTVKGVADPSRPSTVVLSETLARSRTSANAFVVLGLLAIVFLALLLVILRRSRRQSTHRPESPQHL